MGIFAKENRFSDLIKAIKMSKCSNEVKMELIKYVNDVKNGIRKNDFYDDEFLERAIMEIISSGNLNSKIIVVNDAFSDIIPYLKQVFPYGDKTENYDLLRELFINNIFNLSVFFNNKLLGIFTDKRDYIDIINIISDNKYSKYINDIINYAIEVSTYCHPESVLKREIIAFINKVDRCDNIKNLMASCIENAQKRVGIYPIDQKKLALITSEIRQAQNLINKLHNMKITIDNYEKTIDVMTKKGIEELQLFIDTQKNELIRKLDEYLLQIEKELRANSDKVFNQVLLDTQKKINEIKLMATSLSSRTTDELLRIQQASEESVSRLKDLVENDPKVQELLKEAGGESKLREILTHLKLNGTTIVEENPEITHGVYLPGHDRLIVPIDPKLNIPESVDTQINPLFDESIPFDKRMKIAEKRMKEMKDNGEIFHELTDEIVRGIIEGDWYYLWGPSGCGKSYLIEQVAQIIGLDLIDNGKITNSYSVMAYNDVHGRFRATPAFIAFTYGKLLSLDEFDNGNPDNQVLLNPLYSALKSEIKNPNKNHKVTFGEDMRVPVNVNFRMIAAGNTPGNGLDDNYSARDKTDESVFQRMTPKHFFYDNKIEKIIFNGLDSWYSLFSNFRLICDNYAKENGFLSASGIVTTRDANDIAKYIHHNSKLLDQVLREKFVQTKDDNYLNYIINSLRKIYELTAINNVVIKPLKNYSEKELAKQLVYSCDQAIKVGRR